MCKVKKYFNKEYNNINVQALPSVVYAIRISDGVRQTQIENL